MQRYEYKAVPAPTRNEKIKGLKRGDERFAHSLSDAINAEAAAGWEYHRTDTFTCSERRGLFGSVSRTYTLLIFRRPRPQAEDRAPIPVAEHRAAKAEPVVPPAPAPIPETVTSSEAAATPTVPLHRPLRPNGPDPAVQSGSAASTPILRADKSEMPQARRRLTLTDGPDRDEGKHVPVTGPAEGNRD